MWTWARPGGSVKDLAEPESKEDKFQNPTNSVRNEFCLATETGRLRGETSTFVPELNLKI